MIKVIVALLLIAVEPLGMRAIGQPDPKPHSGPITHGQRIFSTGHSFHFGFPAILTDVTRMAGITDSTIVGISSIGGSRVEQHVGGKEVQAALIGGSVDVLMTTPIYLPDPGVEQFARLGFEHNGYYRETVMEFWLPFDQYEPRNYMAGPNHLDPPAKVDHNAAAPAMLRKIHARYFKEMDELVRGINRSLGKQVVYVVPVGQAVITLREAIASGKAPGLTSQEDLFMDALGHPKPPLQLLMAYCHYAVIYRRSPIGLPVPDALNGVGTEKDRDALNRLLQKIAWDSVTHNSLSGVRARR